MLTCFFDDWSERMPRREYYLTRQCKHDGCAERATYAYSTRAEQREALQRHNRDNGWLCTRHSRPNEVLGVDNLEVTAELVSFETDFGHGREMHQFWTKPERLNDEKKHGNGFAYGEGFKAFAKDFPVGTRVIITARIVLPEAENA